MAINVYTKGRLVRFAALFKNAAGAAADPTGVSFKTRSPAGTLITYVYPTDVALVRDSTGNYHIDVAVGESGEWHHRWEGTGAVVTAEDSQLVVEPSAF